MVKEMKTGILTMNRVINYGSFLQAYALQEMLRQIGLDVEFLDIGPEKHTYQQMYPKNPQYRINMLKAQIHRILGHRETYNTMRAEQLAWKYYYTLYNAYPEWWEVYLGMRREDNLNTRYDKIVVGSDEVFNCTQKSEWGYAMKWFGEGLQADTLISYAASFGHTTWEDLRDAELTHSVAENLKNFAAISVRDQNSRDIISRCDRQVENHLDPVLVFDYEKMVTDCPRLRDILIVYTYPNRLTEKSVIEQIQQIAHREKLRIVSIGSFYPWCNNPVLSPFEVLQYFNNAKYVVTDTFHGTVFSLKFGRPFATLIRDSNRQKLFDLLVRLDQQEALLHDEDDLQQVLHRTIPKERIQQKLEQEKEKTLEYLKRCLL